MQALLVSLAFKIGDMSMWQRFFHSKIGLTLASVILGVIGTLGFAPYQLWVVTLVTLSFEFFFVATLKTKKQVFWSLWLYFTAINAATLSWLNFVMNGFGQMPLPVSWLFEILLSAYLSVFHALLGCLAFKLAHKHLKAKATPKKQPQDDYDDDYEDDEDIEDDEAASAQPSSQTKNSSEQDEADSKTEKGPLYFYKNAFFLAFLPVALILADYIAGWLFTGFPWMYIGYTALEGPFSAYAPLLGVRGITLIMFISAGALALTLERRYVYLPVAGVLFAIGIFCQGLTFTKDLPAIKITGIQGNILQQIKWDPSQVIPIIGHYANQSMPYFGASDLIIWPESALPVFAQDIRYILKDLNNMAYKKHTALISGLQHLDTSTQEPMDTYNAIYLLGASPDLEQAQIYKKRQLVPFGEQVPFEEYTRQLGPIFNFPMSGFTAGKYYQSQLKLTLNYTHATAYQQQKAPISVQGSDKPQADTPSTSNQAESDGNAAALAGDNTTLAGNNSAPAGGNATLADANASLTEASPALADDTTLAAVHAEGSKTALADGKSVLADGESMQAEGEAMLAEDHDASANSNETEQKLASTKDLTADTKTATASSATDTSTEATVVDAKDLANQGANQFTLDDLTIDRSHASLQPSQGMPYDTQIESELNNADQSQLEANSSWAVNADAGSNYSQSFDSSLLSEDPLLTEGYLPTDSSLDLDNSFLSNNHHNSQEQSDIFEDVFIDERAYSNFAEYQSVNTKTFYLGQDQDLSDINVYEEPMLELTEGEKEWFNSAIPEFPTEKPIPLAEPMELNFIPAICYESIFPELMTSLHDDKTNGIIMISNDSWFGTTRGPDQHLAIARMRSMEMQKPMIRITNSGYSVLIDKAGKIVQSLPQNKSAILHTDFIPNTGMTPYVRFNNIPLYVILVLLSLLGWYLRKQDLNPLQQNLEALVRP